MTATARILGRSLILDSIIDDAHFIKILSSKLSTGLDCDMRLAIKVFSPIYVWDSRRKRKILHGGWPSSVLCGSLEHSLFVIDWRSN